jgi:sulfur-oxidizing protein SoxA
LSFPCLSRLRAARALFWLAGVVGMAGLVGLAQGSSAPERSLPLTDLRSGIEFAGRDVKALQADALTNPAQLWLEQGRVLWDAPAGASQRACTACHGPAESMKGVAPKFPRVNAATGQLFNLEDQIRHCRSQHQQASAPAFESDELLALSLLVTQASQGLPLRTEIDATLLPHLRAGEALFKRRQGQLNLSCAQCHDNNWGRRLYTDALSQGQPNGYPLYRLEWQKLGSLERRLRSCFAGVRAELPQWGELGQRQLSLYLKWRGEGLLIEVPAVRK